MWTRRDLIQLGTSGLTAAVAGTTVAAAEIAAAHKVRRFHFVQIDVFASQRLLGNPLTVFTDARGLTDDEMHRLSLARRISRKRPSSSPVTRQWSEPMV